MNLVLYSAHVWFAPQEMERNAAAARHSWARQHAWLLLNLYPFPVGQTIYAHCSLISLPQSKVGSLASSVR